MPLFGYDFVIMPTVIFVEISQISFQSPLTLTNITVHASRNPSSRALTFCSEEVRLVFIRMTHFGTTVGAITTVVAIVSAVKPTVFLITPVGRA
jgi:hypothetical protein